MRKTLCLTLLIPASAFYAARPSTRTRYTTRRTLSGDFEGIGSIGDDGIIEEGQKLAHEFSLELKARQVQQSEEELRKRNQQAFSRRREIVSGQEVSSAPSAGFFTGQGQSVYSFPLQSTTAPAAPSSQEYTSKYVERALLIPAVIVMAMLGFYVGLGLSEGGFDRVVVEADEMMSADVAGVERVVPSVFL